MDKYDKAVAYLTEHPTEISKAWFHPDFYPFGCLFAYTGPDSKIIHLKPFPNKTAWGCLTQIRGNPRYIAMTPELTDEIRKDERIPTNGDDITVDHLPIFAEWQRRLDKERTLLNAE